MVSGLKKAWRNLCHDTRVYLASLKVQFKAAAVLRGAFILQVLGMILNNIALTSAWFFFFERFGSVNGWDFPHFVGTQGVVMLVYGLVIFGSSGIMDTPRHVDTGSMDGFLTKPTSVLAQLCSSKMDVTTLGDMIIGLSATVWYMFYVDLSLAAFALFIVSVAVSVVIFLCFVMLLPNVLAFYVFDADRLSRYVGTAFMDGTIYPGGLFSGALRMVLLLAAPALLVGVVPAEILRGIHWEWAGFGVLIAMFWWSVTMWLFRRAFKRYESANLVGAR